MPRLRVTEKAATIDALTLLLEPFAPGPTQPGEVVVEIRSAGVNPSDVKAALGAMPHAVWPRTPGRDWAGLVVDGPADLLGHEVWGSSGDLGIRRDGTHASHIVVPRSYVRLKPASVPLLEAGAVGVPFITAYEGFRRAVMPKPGEVVLVMGATGKVGQAAIQIAAMLGAQVFGVARRPGELRGQPFIDASQTDPVAVLREATKGHGADIVYNTVGSPYFAMANDALALRGRQIFIATLDRAIPFDIFRFYRGQHSFHGIDTLTLDGADCAMILDALTPGFESGTLKPFPVGETFRREQAKEAYRAVLGGAPDRVVFRP
jgi:NADPH:quinone reductase-like Zn-dependent oxidoreductase